MKDSKYRNIYKERISNVLGDYIHINPSISNLVEFLFTRTIWIRRDKVYKAYIDLRGLILTTLSLPPSYRLLILIMAIKYEESQIKYYRNIYKSQDVRINTYSLIEIYLLISNVLKEDIHKDIMLLLPNSVDDLVLLHYERLYNLFPTSNQQSIIRILQNPTSSFMLDIKTINKELNIYTEQEITQLISPLVESNSISIALNHIGTYLGINKYITNTLINIYNSLILDTYQLNQ